MKVRLNVATRPAENHRPFLVGAAVSGAASLVLLGVLLAGVLQSRSRMARDREQLQRYQAEIGQLQLELARLEGYFAQPATRAIFDRIGFANALIDQKSLSWTELLADLAAVLPAGVRVVSLAPQPAGHALDAKLVVEATGDREKLAFLQALEHARGFSQVQVTAESHAAGGTSAGRIELQVQVRYTPGATGP